MQKFFTRRRSLARKAAAVMSAVMLFTSEAGAFLGGAAVVNAADEQVLEEVAAGEAVNDGDGVTTAYDGAFSVSVSKLQYGEDGSNAKGNLDAIFAPNLTAEGAELVLGKDYSVSYRFFADKAEAEAVTAENFADSQGLVLSEVPAGTVIYAVVKAATAEKDYLVSVELTVAKRVISISYKASEEAAIEGRDVAEDGSYVIAEEDVDYSGFDLKAADGFAYELDADAFLAGDVILDLSDVDLSADSLSSVPMEVELDPVFDDNYELDQNIHGNYYITKAQYYVVFTANNNGNTYTQTYAFPDYNYNGTAKELLEKLGKTEEILSVSDNHYTLGGFLNPATEQLTGWTVYTDGFNAKKSSSEYSSGYSDTTVNVNPDASSYESGSKKDYKLSGQKDYLFVAQVSKAAANNLFVSVIPSVYYDTRAHVALGTKVNAKKQAADLRIKVNYSNSGDPKDMYYYTELKMNTDYTVQYYNNTEASMSVSEDGTYMPVKTGDQRPHVVITGKGTYNGFSATVYFDILPINMGQYEYKYDYIHESAQNRDGYNNNSDQDRPYTYVYSAAASVSGISKSTYILKNGKISGISPKVTKYFYTYGTNNNKTTYNTLTLKKDQDYKLEIYKWNETDKCWDRLEGIDDPNKISEAGDYLCLFRGINNYCGAVFGNNNNQFASGKGTDGNINPSHDPGASCQFRVTDSTNYDLSYGTISIGTKSFKWDGVERDAVSFNIVVKDKAKNVLEYGKDYTVSFVPKYSNANGKRSGSVITASNVYTVRVTGKGDYYNRKSGKTVSIKGLKLSKKLFKIDGSNWELSDSGVAAGLVKGDSSKEYYVGSTTEYKSNGSRSLVIGGGSRAGQAIDPAVSVKSAIKQNKKIQLKDAIKYGYLQFTISENGAYNIKGAVPDYIKYTTGKNNSGNTWNSSKLYSGYQGYIDVYDIEGKYVGYAYLTYTFKNNTKVGKTAKVIAKVSGGNCLTGSAEIGTYTVQTKLVTKIKDYNNTTPSPYSFNYGDVYSVVTDAPVSKGSLDKPDVKLYQVYRDKKGAYKAVALSAKQYTLNKGDEKGTNHIAVDTYITNGTAEGFNFEGSYKENGVFSGIFALYKAKITVNDISEVTINGNTYAVGNGVIDSSFAPVFTGISITPGVDKVKALNAELDNGSDYNLGYYTNTAAGEKAGTVMIISHYNKKNDTYEYGGSVNLNFKITPADGVTL